MDQFTRRIVGADQPVNMPFGQLGQLGLGIVNPDALRMTFYRAEGPSYVVAAEAEGDTRVKAPGWPGLTIAFGELWKPSPLERADGA